jgi:hypothetical protein
MEPGMANLMASLLEKNGLAERLATLKYMAKGRAGAFYTGGPRKFSVAAGWR